MSKTLSPSKLKLGLLLLILSMAVGVGVLVLQSTVSAGDEFTIGEGACKDFTGTRGVHSYVGLHACREARLPSRRTPA